MKFPKIQTLWKRQRLESPSGKVKPGAIIEGDYSLPEFASIKKWQATEKIDGMNIRIFFDGESVKVRGRTDGAQIHTMLHEWIHKNFPVDVMQKVCGFGGKQNIENKENNFAYNLPKHEVILFGEGYGRKIQQGEGYYRAGQKFILFDVVINGRWLTREEVETFAAAIRSASQEIHNRESELKTVPVLPYTTEREIVEYVKSQPKSLIAEDDKNRISEGVVVTSDPMLFFRDDKNGGNLVPVRYKLKVSDYRELKKQ